jgi:hypothetical protein
MGECNDRVGSAAWSRPEDVLLVLGCRNPDSDSHTRHARPITGTAQTIYPSATSTTRIHDGQ